MAIEFTESAGKHGFTLDDAIWAMTNARYVEPEFDEPRVSGHVRPTLYVGPSLDPAAPLLEVMVEVLPTRSIVVFHVMKARAKYLDRMD